VKYIPYPYQNIAVAHAVEFLQNATPGQRQLYAAPTGSGKSVVELLVQRALGPTCYIISPREEIIYGMLEKLEKTDVDPESIGLFTPIRLRNLLLKGEVRHPTHIILDETHHESAETWQQLDLLSGLAPAVGYTATPFRGSPKSTRDFLERWGEPIWLLTYQEACANKIISNPSFEMLPLVDDDIIDVQGGDFSITSIDSATVDRLGDMAEHARKWYNTTWDRPTIFALPSSNACVRLQQEMLKRGLPCAVVSANTSKSERRPIFEAVTSRILALLHINIVSEGVDLPLRRLVDLAPTLSPVKWAQQLGRITRPTTEQPEYICTNRNLLRHSYILEGAVPVSALAKAEAAFPQSERAHSRALGLEAIGRFKPQPVKTLSGVNVHIYALSAVSNGVVIEFCCIVHPQQQPLWASKINMIKDGKREYGSWRECPAPADVRGFASSPPKQLSEKQEAWWKKSAARYGLDPSQEVTRKNFQVLPVLSDIGKRV
jgi:hypothetical protein